MAGEHPGAVFAAVNHGGDSDSTGAVTGNIVGARVGLSGIPAKYTDRLELYDIIIEMADDLFKGNPTVEFGAFYDGVCGAGTRTRPIRKSACRSPYNGCCGAGLAPIRRNPETLEPF